jgi:hypothetical protein
MSIAIHIGCANNVSVTNKLAKEYDTVLALDIKPLEAFKLECESANVVPLRLPGDRIANDLVNKSIDYVLISIQDDQAIDYLTKCYLPKAIVVESKHGITEGRLAIA